VSKTRAPLHVPADFGNALFAARMAKNLTQIELAELVGVPQSTISQLENGNSTIFLRRLLALARAIDIELFAEWESRDHPPR